MQQRCNKITTEKISDVLSAERANKTRTKHEQNTVDKISDALPAPYHFDPLVYPLRLQNFGDWCKQTYNVMADPSCYGECLAGKET